MNINNNNNTNININMGNDPPNDVEIFDPVHYDGPYRIRTNNDLFLIDLDGRLVQSNTTSDVWIVEPVVNVYYIRNESTGRYISLPYDSDANGVPIVVVPPGNPTLSRWRFHDILYRSGAKIRSILTDKVLDVPENSSQNNLQIIQYRSKLWYETVTNQRFYFDPA